MTDVITTADKVRLLIGDRDDTDFLLTPGELAYVLTVETDVFLAAIMACDAIIAKLARYPDIQFGKSKETQSQLTSNYEALRDRIQSAVARGEQRSLFVGHIFVDEVDEDDSDTDLVQHHFKVGVHDNTS